MNEPIYMSNPEWWTTNEYGCVVLTDKAPPEAVEAYNRDQEEGNDWYIPGAKKGMEGFIR